VWELQRLRRLIREQLTDAVAEDRLDVDAANGMLEVFGLAALPRRWQVRLSLTFICQVSATGQDEAYDAAEEAIEAALKTTIAGEPVDIDWDDRQHHHATPGDLDPDAADHP
jgi:hypothetical protein